MGELSEETERSRIGTHLLGDRPVQRALKLLRRGSAGARERQHERLVSLGTSEVAEHDRRVKRLRAVLGEVAGARIATATAAGGHKHDRATGLALGEDARELEQRRGARELGLGADGGSVTMSNDRDRAQSRGAGP